MFAYILYIHTLYLLSNCDQFIKLSDLELVPWWTSQSFKVYIYSYIHVPIHTVHTNSYYSCKPLRLFIFSKLTPGEHGGRFFWRAQDIEGLAPRLESGEGRRTVQVCVQLERGDLSRSSSDGPIPVSVFIMTVYLANHKVQFHILNNFPPVDSTLCVTLFVLSFQLTFALYLFLMCLLYN